MNTSGLGVGLPSSGLRACRWMMVAPASAASIDCSADLRRRQRQMRRHRGSVDRPGGRTRDDHLLLLRRHACISLRVPIRTARSPTRGERRPASAARCHKHWRSGTGQSRCTDRARVRPATTGCFQRHPRQPTIDRRRHACPNFPGERDSRESPNRPRHSTSTIDGQEPCPCI